MIPLRSGHLTTGSPCTAVQSMSSVGRGISTTKIDGYYKKGKVWYGMVWGTRDGDPLGGLYCYVRRRSPALSLPRPRALKPAGLTEVGRRTC